MNKKILLISIIVLAVDQLSKTLIDITMNIGQSIPVIKNFFYISYYQNNGAAWGILNDKIPLLLIMSIVILVIIYHYMYTFKMNKRNVLAFGLLTGGIVGNLVDRFLFGYVKDFLDFYIFDYNFPIFNVSDICIVIGVILLIIAIFKGEEVHGRDKSNKPAKKIR